MKLLLVALFALVCFAAAEEKLVRVAAYEPVLNFNVAESRDFLSFRAYSREWQFALWTSDISLDDDNHNQDHFHGRLLNAPDSIIASFTLRDEYVTGMIMMNNDTYWLEATDPTKPTELFIYRSSDVWFHPSVATLQCNHAGEQRATERTEAFPAQEKLKGKRRVLAGYIFRDQFWYSSAYNPSWYTDQGTLGLLNDVNAIYAAYGLSTWSWGLAGYRPNSWTQASQLNSMLNDFSAFSNNAGYSAISNTVTWLVGNNVGGLAWLSSACGAYGNYYKTGVTGLAYWSRLWTVKTIAHELGHNRGAQHDFNSQCGANQASGCQCSIMSYCFPSASTAGGAVNYFTQYSLNNIASTCY